MMLMAKAICDTMTSKSNPAACSCGYANLRRQRQYQCRHGNDREDEAAQHLLVCF
jgi:hypothetical protein